MLELCDTSVHLGVWIISKPPRNKWTNNVLSVQKNQQIHKQMIQWTKSLMSPCWYKATAQMSFCETKITKKNLVNPKHMVPLKRDELVYLSREKCIPCFRCLISKHTHDFVQQAEFHESHYITSPVADIKCPYQPHIPHCFTVEAAFWWILRRLPCFWPTCLNAMTFWTSNISGTCWYMWMMLILASHPPPRQWPCCTVQSSSACLYLRVSTFVIQRVNNCWEDFPTSHFGRARVSAPLTVSPSPIPASDPPLTTVCRTLGQRRLVFRLHSHTWMLLQRNLMTCLIFNVITVLHRGVCWERHVTEEDVKMGWGGQRGRFNCIAFSDNNIHCQGGVR